MNNISILPRLVVLWLKNYFSCTRF